MAKYERHQTQHHPSLIAVVAEVLDAEVLVTVVVLVAELVWTKVVEVWAPPPQAQHAHWAEPSPL